MTIFDFVSSVYPSVRIDCSALALKQVISAARQLDLQHGRKVYVSELDEDMIAGHIRWLKEKNLAADTLHRRVVHFRTIWQIAYRKRQNRNKFYEACLPTIRRPRQKPIAWSTADVMKMLQAAKAAQDPLFGPKHWTALIQLIYFTGIRIGAVLSLERSALHGHVLMVPFCAQKQKEDQHFRLTSDLTNLLIALPRTIPEVSGKLIPYPYCRSNIQRVFARRILKPAGLPTDRKHKFHAMRKTVATVIAATQGIETAMKALGHSSLSVTERYIRDPAHSIEARQ